jgi:5-formyltetrahydrofolate cyclo-ligase
MQKPITRRTVLLRRDRMPQAERDVASAAIASEVTQLLARMPAGDVVALYAAKGTEVDTAPIDAFARARGLRVAYPRIADGQRRLEFCEVEPSALVDGKFAIREPHRDAPVVDLAMISAFVIPGLAFDRAGGRIGWGRGYYDATLVNANPQALRIGLAFECQLVETAARDAHDVPLHYVVTEAAVYRGASA